MRGLIGVLGGMGPMATVDFFQKVIEETPAVRDQDHVPLIIDSSPQIPCRVSAILRGGESPVPAMLAGLRRLEKAGAECAAIACNTAHYWYDDLRAECSLPILHIVDAVGDALEATGEPTPPLGLLATEATLSARIYQKRLSSRKIDFVINTESEREKLVLPAIAMVKQGRSIEAGRLLKEALHLLRQRGAGKWLLACTELPVALAAAHPEMLGHCIDPTRVLARTAVQWSIARRAQP